MALIDITPVMTSNTTPLPYKVSESSYHLEDRGYRAFDKDLSPMPRIFWHSALGVKQWVQLDYGTPTRINAFSITPHMLTATPVDYVLQGSDDGVNFKDIYTAVGITDWVEGVPKLMKFKSDETYRYFRLNTSKDKGYGYIVIREINFYQEDYKHNNVTNKSASLLYCLPSNHTENIRKKHIDSREGLLGYANDDVNYGTLYIVGKNGNAIIPKASMCTPDVLFDGGISVGATLTLNRSIEDYKYIYLYASRGDLSRDVKILLTESITSKLTWYKEQTSLTAANAYRYSFEFSRIVGDYKTECCLYFTDFNSIYIYTITSSGLSQLPFSQLKVYGIK